MRLSFTKGSILGAITLATLAFCLPACSQTGQSPEVKALVKKSLADMVFVKGGTFTMGDFGPQVTPEKLPFTSQQENKPAHPVTLDSFSIGKYKVNLPSIDTIKEKYTPDTVVSQYIYPVGKYPPNALGLYDIGVDGRDWVNDWFAPDYYEHSPAKNPIGPASGTVKVIRGAEGDNAETAMTVYRYKAPPAGYVIKLKSGRALGPTAINLTFRCAVQMPDSL